MKKISKKVVIICTVSIALLIVGFLGFKTTKGSSKIIKVKTTTVSKGELKSYLNTTGVIKSNEIKNYYVAQMKVTKVNNKIGDSVKKGDVLLTYDTTDVLTGVKQAQVQYDNAVIQKQDLLNQKKTSQDKAKDLDNQIKQLEDKIATSKNEKPQGGLLQNGAQNQSALSEDATKLQQLKSQRAAIPEITDEKVKLSENGISVAKATLDGAKSKEANLPGKIFSDIDGVVTALNVQQGDLGAPTAPAISIQNLDNLKVVVSLSKNDSFKISLDQAIEVVYGGKTYNGKISFISPVAKKNMTATSSDVVLDVEGTIMDKIEGVKAEFDTDVNILTGSKGEVTKLAGESIKSEKGGKNSVFVLNSNGTVTQKSVKLGLQSEFDVEILDGVSVGEKVILNPGATIADGIKVVEE